MCVGKIYVEEFKDHIEQIYIGYSDDLDLWSKSLQGDIKFYELSSRASVPSSR